MKKALPAEGRGKGPEGETLPDRLRLERRAGRGTETEDLQQAGVRRGGRRSASPSTSGSILPREGGRTMTT